MQRRKRFLGFSFLWSVEEEGTNCFFFLKKSLDKRRRPTKDSFIKKAFKCSFFKKKKKTISSNPNSIDNTPFLPPSFGLSSPRPYCLSHRPPPRWPPGLAVVHRRPDRKKVSLFHFFFQVHLSDQICTMLWVSTDLENSQSFIHVFAQYLL